MANGAGDQIGANKLGSMCYRLTAKQALDWNAEIDQPYILLMDGAPSDAHFIYLAEQIINVWNKLIKKPIIILCQNEQNELSYQLANNVNEYLGSRIPVPIIKGPFTCAVERAGQKAYKEMRGWYGPKIEAINYYEVPSWESLAWLKNIKRRWRLKCLIKKLKGLGVDNIIVTEFHAGSRTRPEYDEVHGDYLYHSKKDFDSIVNFLNKCGIDIGLYYMSPFLGRKGNDII